MLALQQMFPQWKLQVLFSSSSSLCSFRQLKIDEFESNVNEVKDPYPSADFPGESPGTVVGEGVYPRTGFSPGTVSPVSPTWTPSARSV